MKESLNANLESINKLNPFIPLLEEQLIEIYNISNLIKSLPELATHKLNENITSIVFEQLQLMISEKLTFQNYTFFIVDSILEIKNAL